MTVLSQAGAVADKVRDEQRQLDPVRVLLTLLMVVPFVLGWTVAKLAGVLWLVVSYLWTSAVVGWRTARGEVDP